MKTKDPLEGKTLAVILQALVEHYGWKQMGYAIPINCFTTDPSTSSALKFLRRTPWARRQVELLYLRALEEQAARSQS